MTRQTIYINGYFYTEKIKGGVNRFASEIISAIDELIDIDFQSIELVLLLPSLNVLPPVLKNIKIKQLSLGKNKYIWEQIVLPLYVREHFLINLANFAPIFKKNQLCVIHDALIFRYPQSYSKKFQIITSYFHSQIVRHSKFIATVSQFSASEIINIIGKPQNEIIVIGNSAEHMSSLVAESRILAQFNLKPQQYILSVFSQRNSQYKNVGWYLRAIAEIDYQFVCVGNVDFDDAEVPDNLLQIGYVSDSQLKGLYQNSLGLLFPSLYEGFGIPPLEAMTCGCPVIVSDIPVMHEVCGDGALYFNPTDVNSLHTIVDRLFIEPLRSSLITHGYDRAMLFNWQSSADILLNKCSI
jgi:glycosyltransferase involved in cell wall biosynthesis